MIVIEVEDLSKHFGQVRAVDGVSFAVEHDEIFGFLGPNGAGKTTTINILTGLARKTGGQVSVLGYEYPDSVNDAQMKIGVVPDESNLYAELGGLENLIFAGSLYGMNASAVQKRAKSLLHTFDLADVASRGFGTYSKGRKRKLTKAAALMHEPEILFLDEPTSGIDVASARSIRRMLAELNNQGTTIFLTTHYIEEAERLCDRVAFIVDGKIVKIDKTQNLLNEASSLASLQITVKDNAQDAAHIISQNFPEVDVSEVKEKEVVITADERPGLLPLAQKLADGDIEVVEARLLRSSLEDVFVRLTGIEAEQMETGRGA